MGKFVVCGGNRLFGEVNVHGAKNSVLPILAATVLCEDECIMDNCPDISDVGVTMEIIRALGGTAERSGSSLYVNSSGISKNEIPEMLMRRLRSSVIFLGSILAKCGRARCSIPGGCAIGKRPVNYHLNAFEAMGADARFDGKYIDVKVSEIKDSVVMLEMPSVGATENAMLFACLGERKTVIVNAAKEPEIVDLQEFLNKMGARVFGAGTSVVTIYGVKKLHGTKHKIIPDRIEAATYMIMTAAVGGKVNLKGVNFGHIRSVTDILSVCGADIEHSDNEICIKSDKRIGAYPMINTNPYPGFPTDAQSSLMAAMAVADGVSVIVENIFENRFTTAAELLKMGADITLEGKRAIIRGKQKLKGASVSSPDLRGGAALVTAAVCAEGETVIENTEYIERGYENFENILRRLGVQISNI